MTTESIVSLGQCQSYSDQLTAAVQSLLEGFGGMQAFVKTGQSVLLKPNLLTDRRPEQAVTTHPELVRVLIRMVRACGGSPCVADSPANVVKIEKVWETTGFLEMCRQENVPLINLERAGSTNFNEEGYHFSIANPILNADVIINVPKIKTHVLTALTAAVKNMYGSVPGFQKTQLHKQHPTPRQYGALMARIFPKVRPALNVADGILAMEGDGPSAGSPVSLGLLAASPDAIALDFVLCRILNIDPRAVPYLPRKMSHAGKEGYLSDIRIIGKNIHDVAPASFRVPGTLAARMIPAPLVKLLEPFLWIRPAVSDKCIFCGQCVRACPTAALSISRGQKPILDPAKCIGCCCCHEVCPEKAIAMTQSPFLNFIRKGRLP